MSSLRTVFERVEREKVTLAEAQHQNAALRSHMVSNVEYLVPTPSLRAVCGRVGFVFGWRNIYNATQQPHVLMPSLRAAFEQVGRRTVGFVKVQCYNGCVQKVGRPEGRFCQGAVLQCHAATPSTVEMSLCEAVPVRCFQMGVPAQGRFC